MPVILPPKNGPRAVSAPAACANNAQPRVIAEMKLGRLNMGIKCAEMLTRWLTHVFDLVEFEG